MSVSRDLAPSLAPSPAARLAPGPDSVLVLLHNLKTGGTTLRGIVARQYRWEQTYVVPGRRDDLSSLDLSALDRERVRYVDGHMPFGLHALLGRPAVYISVLRKPVERIVSLYDFALKDPARALYAQTQGGSISLEQFVTGGVSLETDNGQTRRLSGLSPPFGQCSEATLKRAKENIRTQFAAVGLTERFDESLLLMRRLFGWRSVFYLREKVNRARRPAGSWTPESLALVEAHNRFDLELYQFAERLLDERLAAQGPEFQAELASFRALNQQLAVQDDLARRGAPSDDGPVGSGLQVAEVDPLGQVLRAHAELLRRERRTLALRRELLAARQQLQAIQATRLWRLRQRYWQVRRRLGSVGRRPISD
jgi:hypothetical protein